MGDNKLSGSCKVSRIFNNQFDKMNIKNPFGKHLISLLNTANKEQIFTDFSAGDSFILLLEINHSTD